MKAVLFLKAYRRKDEVGGGYRGVVFKVGTDARSESAVLDTLEAAKVWVQHEAHRLMGDTPYRRAHVAKRFTGGSYQAHIWA